MRYTGPKVRLCRREGVNLYGFDKKALSKKPYAPGQAGAKARRRGAGSLFNTQLREKQKVKRMYGLSEKQFYNTYLTATKKQGVAGDNLLIELETRLDNVIFQSGIATTRPQARQFVNHGHFFLNGKKANIPSMKVREGDVIEVRKKSKESNLFKTVIQPKDPYVKWLALEKKDFKVKILAIPQKEDLDQSVDMSKIIEFYSR